MCDKITSTFLERTQEESCHQMASSLKENR